VRRVLALRSVGLASQVRDLSLGQLAIVDPQVIEHAVPLQHLGAAVLIAAEVDVVIVVVDARSSATQPPSTQV